MTSALSLAGSFPEPTEDAWRAAVARARKSTAADEPVEPATLGLHPRRTGAHSVAARAEGAAWRIIDRIDGRDGAVAAATASFMGGANGIELAFASSLHPLGGAIADHAASAIAARLAPPTGSVIRVDAADASAAADAFLDLAAARGAELIFAFDAVAAKALGVARIDEPTALTDVAARFDARGIAGAVTSADGRLWNAGGANEEQELGAVLATFVSYIRTLDTANRIGISLAADPDQFRTIAKFRAMRLLIARVAEVGGLGNVSPHIHAETSWRSMSRREPEINAIRATTAAFAAAVGGADSLTVLPYDAAGTEGGTLARRLARNTQIILADEAHVGRVGDPAAGSGAIEAMTAAFAEAGWKRFQSIEVEGGILAAIDEGSLLRDIAETRETRITRVARGDVPLIGVNVFREDSASATVKLPPIKRNGPLTFKRPSVTFEEDV